MNISQERTSANHHTRTALAVRVLLAAIITLMVFPARHAAAASRGSSNNSGIGDSIGNSVGDSASEGAAVIVGVSAAAVAVVGLGVWWFFFHGSDETVPAGLTSQGRPVDVASGAKVGLDCPGSDGNPSVACW